MTTNPLCVALDDDDRDRLLALARNVAPHAGLLKVGLTAFTSFGPDLVREIAAFGPVFLDLKLHDIPAQVGGAARGAAALGANYVTVHAAGGPAMVRAAVDGAGSETTVLAVTLLTSLGDADLTAIGIEGPPDKAVVRLAELAVDSGAGGLVCSPLEVAALRERFGSSRDGGPLLVVPGIRAPGAQTGDQQRTLGARDAIANGADVIVVGRPITKSGDPAAAARALLEELSA